MNNRRLFAVCTISAAGMLLAAWTQEKTKETGAGLHWCVGEVHLLFNEDGTSSIDDGSDLDALRKGMEQWNEVTCNHPILFDEGLTDSRDTGGGGVPSRNLVVFRSAEEWKQADYSPSVLAMTVLWYKPDTGKIYKATMELNDSVQWSVDTPPSGTDLWNTATHEFGHLLGMDHSSDPRATMYPYTGANDTTKRDLADDDEQGICAIYATQYSDCIPKGCGCSTGVCTAGGAGQWLAALLVLWWGLRRRRVAP